MMQVRQAIADLEDYNPPLEGREDAGLLLLDFNESTQPPAPEVLQALQEELHSASLQRYPAYGPLPDLVAEYTGVSPAQVLLTNGCDSAIQLVCQAMLAQGDEAISPQPGFFVIHSNIQACGATLIAPAYQGEALEFPLQAVLEAISPRTRLVALVNPNNPTGTLSSLAEVEQVLQACPQAAVMLDETYFEFCGLTALPLLERYPNLVVLRSFSKAMAVAGLRLGCVLGQPEFITQLHKLRIPYDVNRMAVAAGQALLRNTQTWQAYVEEVMQRAKPLVERFFQAHQVRYLPGAANFMLVRPAQATAAAQILRQQGVVLRPQKGSLQGWLRMSIGTVPHMQRFIAAYQHVLQAERHPISMAVTTHPGTL